MFPKLWINKVLLDLTWLVTQSIRIAYLCNICLIEGIKEENVARGNMDWIVTTPPYNSFLSKQICLFVGVFVCLHLGFHETH